MPQAEARKAPAPPAYKVLRGLNTDPLNPGGRTDPSWMRAHNFNAVRMVGRPDPSVESYAAACVKADLFVLDTITSQSQGQLLYNAHLYQLRNEIDIESPSSEGVIPPAQYAEEVLLYLGTYGNLQFILGSLAAGDYSCAYLTEVCDALVQQAGSAGVPPNLVGISLHPYGKRLSEAQRLIAAHIDVASKAFGRPMAAYVTEWNRVAKEIPGFDWYLRTGLRGGAAWWFCADDAMVPGFGLTTNGRPKPELAQFHPFDPNPAPPHPAAYVPALVTSDWMSEWDNGTYPSRPLGFLLHGSRSGVDSLTTLEEFWGTAHFTKARQDGLAYTATVGTDMVSWGLSMAHWGWHARGCSDKYIGVEFAQPLESHPIDNGQVRAFVWLVRQARAIWPDVPLQFPTHAEVDGTAIYGGYHDGKTDVFSKGSPATNELRVRIANELLRQGVH